MRSKIVFFSIIAWYMHISVYAQSYSSLIRNGVQHFEREQYDQAEVAFRQALRLNEDGFEAHFNLGNTLYRQGRFDEAKIAFQEARNNAPDRSSEAKANHNLGNTEVELQKYQEAIEAYKKSLLRNPSDEETRSNLAYAMRRLQEQQQNQSQQQQQEGEESNDDDNQENQDQQQQQQEQEQGEQDQNPDQDEDSDQEQQGEGEQELDENTEQESPSFDPDDAERLMQMIEDEESKVQEKLIEQERKKRKDTRGKKIW